MVKLRIHLAFETILDSTQVNEQRAQEVIQKSREKYTGIRSYIEEDIDNGIFYLQINNGEPSGEDQRVEEAKH